MQCEAYISNYVAINFYDRPKDTLELTRKEGVEQMQQNRLNCISVKYRHV